MSLRSATLCTFFVLATTPAIAAGFTPAADVAAPVAPTTVTVAPTAAAPSGDWTGFYVGGRLSYGSLNLSVDEDLVAEGDDNEENYDGSLFGVHAGYMRDFGRLVAGAELAYEGSTISIEDDELEGVSLDIDSVARLGARVGYDAGRALPYLTAGVGRISLATDGLDEEFGEELDEELDARFIGAGVDFKLRENLILGAEVIYHDVDLEAFGVDFDDEGIDTSLTTIGLRASYRF